MPTNDPAPLIAATPAGMDLGRIEQAMRLLAETALERLTKPSFDEAPDDEGGSQRREGEMDVGPSLVADGEATELGEPSQGPLDDPPVTSQPLAALDPAPGDAGLDAAAGQRLTAAAVVVGLVGVQLRGPLARRSPA